MIIECIQTLPTAQPTAISGVYYSLRTFVGTNNSSRIVLTDPGLPSNTVLFWGVSDMVLDLCSQMVNGEVPSDRQTTKDGNYDISDLLMFTGTNGVYQNRTCKQKLFLLSSLLNLGVCCR